MSNSKFLQQAGNLIQNGHLYGVELDHFSAAYNDPAQLALRKRYALPSELGPDGNFLAFVDQNLAGFRAVAALSSNSNGQTLPPPPVVPNQGSLPVLAAGTDPASVATPALQPAPQPPPVTPLGQQQNPPSPDASQQLAAALQNLQAIQAAPAQQIPGDASYGQLGASAPVQPQVETAPPLAAPPLSIEAGPPPPAGGSASILGLAVVAAGAYLWWRSRKKGGKK